MRSLKAFDQWALQVYCETDHILMLEPGGLYLCCKRGYMKALKAKGLNREQIAVALYRIKHSKITLSPEILKALTLKMNALNRHLKESDLNVTQIIEDLDDIILLIYPDHVIQTEADLHAGLKALKILYGLDAAGSRRKFLASLYLSAWRKEEGGAGVIWQDPSEYIRQKAREWRRYTQQRPIFTAQSKKKRRMTVQLSDHAFLRALERTDAEIENLEALHNTLKYLIENAAFQNKDSQTPTIEHYQTQFGATRPDWHFVIADNPTHKTLITLWPVLPDPDQSDEIT